MPDCTLERLRVDHLDGLVEAADDDEAWTYMIAPSRGREGMRKWMEKRLAVAVEGKGITWVVRDHTAAVVGSTSVYDLDRKNGSCSVGYTWLTTSARGTGLNAIMKSLVLSYCFNQLDLRRVQFTVDGRNLRSQRAMAKLGATREGTLRSHRVLPDGFVRDTVLFSVLQSEWPSVRERLESDVARRRGSAEERRFQGELHA